MENNIVNAEEIKLTQFSRGAGCGCKIAQLKRPVVGVAVSNLSTAACESRCNINSWYRIIANAAAV